MIIVSCILVIKAYNTPNQMCNFNYMTDNKPRILIIDDDESSVQMLRRSFAEAGFEVMVGFDGVEGLDLATKHMPDVIFTGIIMPRMSGFEMMRNLQNNVTTAKIPVIVYSHLGREGDKTTAKELGVRDFLVRGITTPNEIIERVRQAVTPGRTFYVAIDPAIGDAKALHEAFHFKHRSTCREGGEAMLRLQSLPDTDETGEFKAMYICKEAWKSITQS